MPDARYSPRVTSRDRILDAAGRILVRDGGDAVTIAAVAREAGVSKGGLFYHFASKELLIDGLIARYVATFDELIIGAGEEPGAATEAYLRSAERTSGPAGQPVIALLAAAVVNPRALDSLRERYRAWQDRLDRDGVPAEVAATIRFAVDGLWLADTLDLAPARGAARQRMIGELRALLAR
nr:TetR/AcrR family transcriptional regulator [Naumannella cuiyingiana]